MLTSSVVLCHSVDIIYQCVLGVKICELADDEILKTNIPFPFEKGEGIE